MEINKEILELAALAGGHEYTIHLVGGSDYALSIGGLDFWAPHTNIADAARLAVKLGLRVTTPKYKGDGSTAEPQRGNTASCTAFRADPIEQTCVAITLCAAEIGRRMKEAK